MINYPIGFGGFLFLVSVNSIGTEILHNFEILHIIFFDSEVENIIFINLIRLFGQPYHEVFLSNQVLISDHSLHLIGLYRIIKALFHRTSLLDVLQIRRFG